MGLLEEELREIRIMHKQFCDGKVDAKSVGVRVSMYSQSQKRARLIMQAHMFAGIHGNGAFNDIVKTNLIGDAQAIDINVDLETEKIVCPLTDEPISRAACLDYSGGHSDDCAGCENKKITQDRLLGEKV